MKIKNILAIFKKVRYIKNVLRRYSDRMVKGNYVMHDNFRALALSDEKIISCANSYFVSPNVSPRMVGIARKVNNLNCFVNRNRKTTAEYDAIYTSNNLDKVREVKLFSFKNNKILTICTSQEEKDKQIEQYEWLKNDYNLPCVKGSDYYPNAYEISMIFLKDFPGDEAALRTICQSTIKANPMINGLNKISVKELIKYSYENEEIDQLLNSLCLKINENVLNLEIPICKQHGDLSKQNLLYGIADEKKDFWWIDWEHINERVFFYDFFFYIINSAFYSDTKAYDIYMSGKIDDVLNDYFSHFGLSFETEKKKEYLMIFAVVFLKERVCDFGRVEALKEYCDFIDTH